MLIIIALYILILNSFNLAWITTSHKWKVASRIIEHYLQLQLNRFVDILDGKVGKENDDTDNDEKFMALEMQQEDFPDPFRRTYLHAASCIARLSALSGSP